MGLIRLDEISWYEAEKALKEHDTAIIPIGTIEEHGPHLRLGTDYLSAFEVAKIVAEKLDAILLPPMPYGHSKALRDYPGTLTISRETLENFTKEICRSLIRHGTKKIIIINGHGGNIQALATAAAEIVEETGAKVMSIVNVPLVYDPEMKKFVEEAIRETRRLRDFIHACEIESSWMLYLRPDLVHMEKAAIEYAEFPPNWPWLPRSLHEICKTGVFGDATKATREKGRKWLRRLLKELLK